MKQASKTLLFVGGFILFSTCYSIRAQEQFVTMSQLKEQILTLERVDRDPSITSEVKRLNYNFLEERRTQLRALLKTRINALTQYKKAAAASLSRDEIQVIENSIRNLEDDLHRLEISMQRVRPESAGVKSAGNSKLAPAYKRANLAEPAAPQVTSADCGRLCKLPKKDKDYVMIDANTGKIIEGTTRFEEGAKVQVIFVNKNPFKYDYRFEIVSEPLSTAIASAFLSLIPGLNPVVPSTPSTSISPQDALCPNQPQRDAIFADAQNLKNNDSKSLAAAINAKMAEFNPVNDKYNKFFADTQPDLIANCEVVCNDANSLLPQLQGFNAGNLPDLLSAFKGKVSALETKFNALSADCKDADLTNLIDSLKKDVDSYDKNVKTMQDGQKMFDQMAKIIKAAFASDSPFFEVHYPQNAGGPTGVRITMFRKNLRVDNSPEKTVATINLQVGESPLSLSAGIGFSTIPDRHIVRQASLGDDGKTLVNRFGYDSNAPRKPSGIIMLNGRLATFNFFGEKTGSFALSSGLVLSSRNNTVEPEFIAGPSLGMLRDTMFLTFGYHTARVEKLGGNFKIGDVVPSNLNDPLPLEKRWTNGFLIGLTYKLR